MLAKLDPVGAFGWITAVTSAVFGSLWLLLTQCGFEKSSGISEVLGVLDFYFSRLPLAENRVLSAIPISPVIACNYEKLRVLHTLDLALLVASVVFLVVRRRRLAAWVCEKWPGGSARLGDYNLVPAIIIASLGLLIFFGLERDVFGGSIAMRTRLGESRWLILLDSLYVTWAVAGVTGAGARLVLTWSRRASAAEKKSQ